MTDAIYIDRGVMHDDGIVSFAKAMKVTEDNIDEVYSFVPDATIIIGLVTEGLLNNCNFGDEFFDYIGSKCIVVLFDNEIIAVPFNCYLVKDIGKSFIGDPEAIDDRYTGYLPYTEDKFIKDYMTINEFCENLKLCANGLSE